MMDFCRILTLSALILFASCEKEAPPDPDPDPPVVDCSVQVSDTDMVVGITETDSSIVFQLESGQEIIRPAGCIQSYQVDSVLWTVHLTYQDQTEDTLPFFGQAEIPRDSIVLNPYGFAPLTALVHFSIPYPRRVRVTVHGKGSGSLDLSHTFPEPDTNHAIPVYGLYGSYLNQVSIGILGKDGTELRTRRIQIRTGPLGNLICGPMYVTVNNYKDSLTPHFYLIHNAIYDNTGQVRWYTPFGASKYFTLYDHQIAMQIHGDKGNPVSEWEDIRILSLLGEQTGLYDVPNRNHHEINEKTPGGNLLVATNAEPYYSTDDDTEDAIVEIDRQTGEVVKFWDLREIFDPDRERIWEEMPNDWCHLNSIQYDPSDNTLLISSKLQYFISKIDYETGAIKWIFGNHENWGEQWQPYLLEPENFDTIVHPDRDWTYAQHMPRLTKEGNIIVYDNGRNRPGGDFTRVHEFRVDTAQMTVRTIWTHDFSYSTRALGSIYKHENNNVLIGHGEGGLLIEVNHAGEVLFEGKLKNFYRAYPIEFYQQ
jgi:arylsulfate sulfotransferase